MTSSVVCIVCTWASRRNKCEEMFKSWLIFENFLCLLLLYIPWRALAPMLLQVLSGAGGWRCTRRGRRRTAWPGKNIVLVQLYNSINNSTVKDAWVEEGEGGLGLNFFVSSYGTTVNTINNKICMRRGRRKTTWPGEKLSSLMVQLSTVSTLSLSAVTDVWGKEGLGLEKRLVLTIVGPERLATSNMVEDQQNRTKKKRVSWE